MKRWKFAILTCFVASCFATQATTFLELESSYLGDGWFSYRMTLEKDPFFENALIGSLGLNSSDWTENGANPSEWTNGTQFAEWSYALTNNWWQERPYERTFYVRSGERAFRLGTNHAVITFSLWPRSINNGQWLYSSANIVGYATLPCLVPCPPEQADNSPSSYLYTFKIIPDIQMGPLVTTNDRPYGVTYDWPETGLVEIQGTSDFNTWTPIARVNGDAGHTVWTTNSPIDAFGSSFRVQLITGYFAQNALPKKPAVSALRCTPGVGTMTVTFNAPQDGTYLVEARSLKGELVASQAVNVSAGKGTASFSTAKFPSSTTFSVKPQ